MPAPSGPFPERSVFKRKSVSPLRSPHADSRPLEPSRSRNSEKSTYPVTVGTSLLLCINSRVVRHLSLQSLAVHQLLTFAAAED